MHFRLSSCSFEGSKCSIRTTEPADEKIKQRSSYTEICKRKKWMMAAAWSSPQQHRDETHLTHRWNAMQRKKRILPRRTCWLVQHGAGRFVGSSCSCDTADLLKKKRRRNEEGEGGCRAESWLAGRRCDTSADTRRRKPDPESGLYWTSANASINNGS